MVIKWFFFFFLSQHRCLLPFKLDELDISCNRDATWSRHLASLLASMISWCQFSTNIAECLRNVSKHSPSYRRHWQRATPYLGLSGIPFTSPASPSRQLQRFHWHFFELIEACISQTAQMLSHFGNIACVSANIQTCTAIDPWLIHEWSGAVDLCFGRSGKVSVFLQQYTSALQEC